MNTELNQFSPLALFKPLTLLCGLAWLVAPVQAAPEDPLQTLPEAVQKTARETVGNSKIEEVEDTIEDGGRAFEVEFERDGKHLAVVIAPNGKVIQTEERISVDETPEAVGKAVSKEFPDGTISHIKKIDKPGAEPFFQVSIRAGTTVKKLKLHADGSRVESGR